MPSEGESSVIAEVRKALHDISQPLTAMQCRLYLGAMETEADAIKSAIVESLEECARMIARMRTLQDRMEELRGDKG